jgi:acid phosphatase
MENRELNDILAFKAPFEHQLIQRGALSSQFYSVRHNSTPDYLAATSGIDPNVFRTGGYNVSNIGTLISNAGESWISYFEGMPQTCYNKYDWLSGYEVTHDPFVQYTDVWHNGGGSRSHYCQTHVVPFNQPQWNASLATGNIPNYVMIEPSIFHDQHSGSVQAGSAWLQSVISPIFNSSVWSSTAIFVSYDEGLGVSEAGFNHSFAGNIYTVIVSPVTPAGFNSTHPYQTYSILTTTEWLLGLGRTGQNDSWALFPPMYDSFSFTNSKTVGGFKVSGTITNGTSGLPIPGAHIVVTNQGTISSGYANGTNALAKGAYSMRVPSGTWTIFVSENGYTTPPPQTLVVSGGPVPNENFKLYPQPFTLFAVSGTVTNAQTKAPIAYLQILFTSGGFTKEVQTDSSGYYVQPLTNGTYQVNAIGYPNYVNQTKTITVNGSQVRGIGFKMVPTGNVNPSQPPGASTNPPGAPPPGGTPGSTGPSGHSGPSYLSSFPAHPLSLFSGISTSANPTRSRTLA